MRITLQGNAALKAFLNPKTGRGDTWTASEDQIILDMAESSSHPWPELSSKLCRSPSACLGRYEKLVKRNRPSSSCKRRTTEESVEKMKRSKVVSREVMKVGLEEVDKLVIWQQLQDAIQASRDHMARLEKLSSKVEQLLNKQNSNNNDKMSNQEMDSLIGVGRSDKFIDQSF